jgi:hypothetical protein
MSDCDWVTSRVKCSVFEVFSRLRTGVQGDLERRALSLPPDTRMSFKMREEQPPWSDRFTVLRLGDTISDSIEFSYAENTIRVKDAGGRTKITAKLTLNDDGDCRLKVDDQEL